MEELVEPAPFPAHQARDQFETIHSRRVHAVDPASSRRVNSIQSPPSRRRGRGNTNIKTSNKVRHHGFSLSHYL
jgi:hypothetical protein